MGAERRRIRQLYLSARPLRGGCRFTYFADNPAAEKLEPRKSEDFTLENRFNRICAGRHSRLFDFNIPVVV